MSCLVSLCEGDSIESPGWCQLNNAKISRGSKTRVVNAITRTTMNAPINRQPNNHQSEQSCCWTTRQRNECCRRCLGEKTHTNAA